MSFCVRKQKSVQDVGIEQEILNSTEIKTEEDLKKFLADVSKNGTNYKTTRTRTKTTSGFTNRRSKNEEEL